MFATIFHDFHFLIALLFDRIKKVFASVHEIFVFCLIPKWNAVLEYFDT